MEPAQFLWPCPGADERPLKQNGLRLAKPDPGVFFVLFTDRGRGTDLAAPAFAIRVADVGKRARV
jgi:hypothetical protein